MTAEFIVAVHSVVYLNHNQSYKSSEEIANNVCTNPARVRKILSKLKNHKIISAKTSAKGGYTFTKNPKTVTLYDILQALEEDVVSVSWRSGDKMADCPISNQMETIINSIFTDINETANEKLKEISIYDIDKAIFKNGDLKL